MKKEQLSIDYRILPREEFDDALRQLEDAAIEAARKAYAPYSHFSVGAALLKAHWEVCQAFRCASAIIKSTPLGTMPMYLWR